VIPGTKTDLRNDITPFVIITDRARQVLASSASLDGQTALPPQGVFTYTKVHEEDRLTWQPAKHVRLATVVTAYKIGSDDVFIITGQSLKQFEERVRIYDLLAITTWLIIVAWTSLVLFLPKPGG